MRLLYAEDEPAMAEAVADILTYHKYTVDTVDNGQDALEYALNEDYDGIILDVMMPRMDGLTVLTKLRSAGKRTPVLLLTARAEVTDRIQGLDMGADDYLPKPFVMEELLARIRALLRRNYDAQDGVLSFGDITLNTNSATLTSSENGQSIRLSDKEFRILEYMIANKGNILTREQLALKIVDKMKAAM